MEVSADPDTILSNAKIRALIGDKCDGVIGQLTEVRLGRGGSGAVWLSGDCIWCMLMLEWSCGGRQAASKNRCCMR